MCFTIIYSIFFSYSTNKIESTCANPRYTQCLKSFSYLLTAVTSVRKSYRSFDLFNFGLYLDDEFPFFFVVGGRIGFLLPVQRTRGFPFLQKLLSQISDFVDPEPCPNLRGGNEVVKETNKKSQQKELLIQAVITQNTVREKMDQSN